MRVFVAADIPSRVRENLSAARIDLVRKGVEGLRWAAPEGVHLTLRFCGELAAERVARIAEALAPGPPGPAFSLRLKGLGVFPPRGKPRVLWLGVEASGALSDLAAWVEKRVLGAGLLPEQRAFHPHLTLGRFRSRGGKMPRSLLESWLPSEPREFRLDRVVLFESHLSPRGAHYEALNTYPLQPGEGNEGPE